MNRVERVRRRRSRDFQETWFVSPGRGGVALPALGNSGTVALTELPTIASLGQVRRQIPLSLLVYPLAHREQFSSFSNRLGVTDTSYTTSPGSSRGKPAAPPLSVRLALQDTSLQQRSPDLLSSPPQLLLLWVQIAEEGPLPRNSRRVFWGFQSSRLATSNRWRRCEILRRGRQ